MNQSVVSSENRALIGAFLDGGEVTGLSRHSRYNCRWATAGLAGACGDLSLLVVDRDTIEAWIAPMSATTRAQSLWGARTFYRWATTEALVDGDPTFGIPTKAGGAASRRRRRPREEAKRTPHRRPRPDDTLVIDLLARGLAPRTADLYAVTIRRADRWWRSRGGTLAAATPVEVALYARQQPETWASRKSLRSALQHYWAMVGRDDPPLRAIRVPPKPAMVCKALEPDDARILAKAAVARDDDLGLAVALGLYEALRREEIATLPWSAFNGEWLTVTGKGTVTATIPLHPKVAVLLERKPREGRWLFPGRFGGPVSPATIWEWVKVVAAEAGVEGVTPHILRHVSLATANDATGDLRTVQAFARHSSPLTTSGYTRTSKARLRAVVEALDYDS